MALRARLILVAMLRLASVGPALRASDAVKAMAGSADGRFPTPTATRPAPSPSRPTRAHGLQARTRPGCGKPFPSSKTSKAGRSRTTSSGCIDARGKAVVRIHRSRKRHVRSRAPGRGTLFPAKRVRALPTCARPTRWRASGSSMHGEQADLRHDARQDARSQSGRGARAARSSRAANHPVARLNFVLWRMDQGELVLAAAGGQSWRFEEKIRKPSPGGACPKAPTTSAWCGSKSGSSATNFAIATNVDRLG